MFKAREICYLIQGNGALHLVARRYNFQEKVKVRTEVILIYMNQTLKHYIIL